MREDQPMPKNRVAAVVAICLVVLVGVSVWASSQTTAPQVRIQCSLDQKGAYDQGWLQPSGGSHYRCMQTYDPALKPIGASWVKVEADGTIGGTLPR